MKNELIIQEKVVANFVYKKLHAFFTLYFTSIMHTLPFITI